jgi:hypothetical protein
VRKRDVEALEHTEYLREVREHADVGVEVERPREGRVRHVVTFERRCALHRVTAEKDSRRRSARDRPVAEGAIGRSGLWRRTLSGEARHLT